MKLIFAIANAEDGAAVQSALTSAGHMVTKLSSTGGFLRQKNLTLMIGVEDSELDEVLSLISRYCKKRSQHVPASDLYGDYAGPEMTVTAGGATVFVTDVERFEKL